MNPVYFQEAQDLVKQVEIASEKAKGKIIVCPPIIFLQKLSEKRSGNFSWGAQNCFWEKSGAHTGEISPAQAKSMGVRYCLVGHSERREDLLESDKMINKKIKVLLQENITPILCVGGGTQAKKKSVDVEKVIQEQLREGFKGVPTKSLKDREFLVAYEPVWAIGTGKVATPKHVSEISFFTKKVLQDLYDEKIAGSTAMIYGGSINSGNAQKMQKKSNIDGYLVGGASLNSKEFLRLVEVIN